MSDLIRFRNLRLVLQHGLILLAAALASARGGDFSFTPDVAYLAADRTEKLDLYLPVRADATLPAPAVVWIHGLKGDKGEKRGRSICETLAAAGYVAVSINHGPDREFTGNMLDCKNAVRFLRAHAAKYGIDPARIAIMGGSMGGYHALMAAVTAGLEKFEPAQPYPGVSSAVRAVVDFYGPLGPPGYKVTGFLNAQSPPVLVLHGELDKTVPPSQSVELVAALEQHGIEHRFILLPGIGHTFRLDATWDDKPLPQDLTPVVLGFLAEHLGAPAPSPTSR